MLNGSKKWIEINPFGKNFNPDGEGDNDDPVIPDVPEDKDVIYDGGAI